MTQQARHLTWTLAERAGSFRFLIRDRDQKFTASFDEVFRSDEIQVIPTPFRAPQAKDYAVAERFVRTLRSEYLDWLLILNQQHPERDLDVFVAHDNGHRPHRALTLNPPHPTRRPVPSATRGARLVSSVATVSVVWFTSTFWRRDQISAPYRRAPRA